MKDSKILRIAELVLQLAELQEQLNSYDIEKEHKNRLVICREMGNRIKLEIRNGIITQDEGIDLAIEFCS